MSTSAGGTSKTTTVFASDLGLKGIISIAVDARARLYVLGYTNNEFRVVFAASSVPGGAILPTGVVILPNLPSSLNYYYDLAVDSVGTLYVSEADTSVSGKILVYAPTASDSSPPIRRIAGPRTQLLEPFNLTTDSLGNLIVLNLQNTQFNTTIENVLIFTQTANGDQTPAGVISGNRTGFGPATSRFTVATSVATDALGDIILAIGNEADGVPWQISVFGPSQRGDVTPERSIAGSSAGISGLTAVAADPDGTIYAGASPSSVTASAIVQVFTPGAIGNVAPARSLMGSSQFGGIQKIVIAPS